MTKTRNITPVVIGAAHTTTKGLSKRLHATGTENHMVNMQKIAIFYFCKNSNKDLGILVITKPEDNMPVNESSS